MPLVGTLGHSRARFFRWSPYLVELASPRILRRMPLTDVLVMALVTMVTVVSQNLALAVLLGVVV